MFFSQAFLSHRSLFHGIIYILLQFSQRCSSGRQPGQKAITVSVRGNGTDGGEGKEANGTGGGEGKKRL